MTKNTYQLERLISGVGEWTRRLSNAKVSLPAGSFVIAFSEIRTWNHNFNTEKFQSGDFLFKYWFDDEKLKRAVEEARQVLIRKEEMIYDTLDLLARFNIEEPGKAMEHIKQLEPNS